MPLTRDPRNDRRRRVLRESGPPDASQQKKPAGNSNAESDDSDSSANTRRDPGYSQDVRKACGQRLVQLIPVRPFSYLAACAVSASVPSLLLCLHYMIYVSGWLRWYGHPLAVSLDASHPSSIAAWFGSHLWLVCLVATVLTFQLRRHKLDDYRGEYRLWFWLVLTCLLASIDATTRLSDLMGMALDSWSQINLGVSGPFVMNATMAALIGMLGLRLCSELKSVPLSLMFWLVGLTSWAGSAALAQEEFRLEMTLQFRIWLKSTLWLAGLTSVWLAALTYLRAVYREAQQRFLIRSRVATPRGGRNQPKRAPQDLRKPLPKSAPQQPAAKDDREPDGKKRSLNPFGRRRTSDAADSPQNEASRNSKQTSIKKPRFGFGLGRSAATASDPTTTSDPQAAAASGGRTEDSPKANKSSSKLSSWLKPPKDADDVAEYRKVNRDKSVENKSSDKAGKDNGNRRSWFTKQSDASAEQQESETKPKKSWFSKSPKASQQDGDAAATKKQPSSKAKKKTGLLSRFKLQPPVDQDESDNLQSDNNQPKRQQSGTSHRQPGSEPSNSNSEHESGNNSRPLTKAERRKMRKMQQRRNRAA